MVGVNCILYIKNFYEKKGCNTVINALVWQLRGFVFNFRDKTSRTPLLINFLFSYY